MFDREFFAKREQVLQKAVAVQKEKLSAHYEQLAFLRVKVGAKAYEERQVIKAQYREDELTLRWVQGHLAEVQRYLRILNDAPENRDRFYNSLIDRNRS